MSILDKMIQSETIHNAYEEWKDYREEITGFILSQCSLKKTSGKPIMAIWGAGCSNDIDLKRLSRAYMLVLIDRNKDDLQAAMDRYGLHSADAICVDIPFWDIDYEMYEMFEAMLKEAVECEVVAEYLMKIAFVNSGHNSENMKPRFDYSVCIGIHSQLNVRLAGLLYAYKENYDEAELRILEKIIKGLNVAATERLNDIMYQLTSSRIIWGYEVAAVGMEDMNVTDIDSEDFPDRVEGALQLEKDIALHNGFDMKVISRKRVFWPFERKKLKKGYIMELLAADKI